MRAHKCGSQRDDGHAIKRAIKKHGHANVTVDVLEEVKLENLNKAEVEWIARKDTIVPKGYNLTPGGEYQPMNNPTIAAWQKEQIRKAMRQESTRQKMFNHHRLRLRKKVSSMSYADGIECIKKAMYHAIYSTKRRKYSDGVYGAERLQAVTDFYRAEMDAFKADV